MNRIILFLFLLVPLCTAQTDWEYWPASKASYVKSSVTDSVKDQTADNFTHQIISGARSLYSFLISDLDGDNCPFHPTCSQFFVEAAGKTNIIKSVLMFADRFTRDINITKGSGQYRLWDEKHYFDPVENYLLDINLIRNIPIRKE